MSGNALIGCEPLPSAEAVSSGAIAQLGERVLCKHEVVGSIPSGSTRRLRVEAMGLRAKRERETLTPPTLLKNAEATLSE